MQSKQYLLASGSNGKAQLGMGHTLDVSQFTPCTFSTLPAFPPNATILQLTSGAGHSLLLLGIAGDDGVEGRNEIWVTGSNEYGQLGRLPTLTTSWTRLDVNSLLHEVLPESSSNSSIYRSKLIGCSWTSSFIVFSCSSSSSMAHSDVIISLGTNDFGELGIGQSERQAVNLVHLPYDRGSVIQIRALRAGQRHVVCLVDMINQNHITPKQIVYGWGASRHGQLDWPTTSSEANDAGPSSSSPSSSRPNPPPASSRGGRPPRLATPKLPSKHPATTPLPKYISPPSSHVPSIRDICVGSSHTILHFENGEVIGFGGGNGKGQLEGLSEGGKFKAVGATWNGTVVCSLRDGLDEIHATGSNTHGQLGRGPAGSAGSNDSGLRPVGLPNRMTSVSKLVCGSEHTLALCSSTEGQDVELWAWGWNEHGNLGFGDLKDRWAPERLDLGTLAFGDEGVGRRVKDAWAGCGSSWVLIEMDNVSNSL